MTMILPRDLESEVYDFIELVKAKGQYKIPQPLDVLVRNLQLNSSAIDTRVKDIATSELLSLTTLTSKEYQFVLKLVAKLEKWRGPRFHRQKVAQPKVKLCVSLTEMDSMDAIRNHTKEGPSFVVRRLLREEAARIAAYGNKPEFSN